MTSDKAGKIIGLDDLIAATGGTQLGADVQMLVDLLATTAGPLRATQPGQLDAQLMTACIVYAGAVYGELLEMQVAPPMTPEAINSLLQQNFANGVIIGRERIQRIAARMGVDRRGRPLDPAPGRSQ